MRKPTRNSGRTKVALTAAAMTLPMLGGAQEAPAQDPPAGKPTVQRSKTAAIKQIAHKHTIKLTSNVQIVGTDDGRIIYRNSGGELFYLDESTGDMKFIKATSPALKQVVVSHKHRAMKDRALKFSDKTLLDVSIVGTDAKGNLLHRTSQGETFFLDPATGDMVFVEQ